MTIDVRSEKLISLAEAATRFPRYRAGRPISVSTVRRYATSGRRGIVLETVHTPQLATSVEAVERFIDRLTVKLQPAVIKNRLMGDVGQQATRANRQESVERALDALGIQAKRSNRASIAAEHCGQDHIANKPDGDPQ